MIDKGNIPIEDQTLYLPPTKSQNSNTISSEIPNSRVADKLVEQATKCYLIESLLNLFINKFLHKFAFVNVSSVVNVFDIMTTRVCSKFILDVIW